MWSFLSNIADVNAINIKADMLCSCCLVVFLATLQMIQVNPGVIVTPCHKNSGMSEEDYARCPWKSSWHRKCTVSRRLKLLQIVRFLEHSKTTHAMGRPGTVQEVQIFKMRWRLEYYDIATNAFNESCCSRWQTRWPSWQGRGPLSSLGKPLPSMGAGALCVLDRDWEENPSRCFFMKKRKIK